MQEYDIFRLGQVKGVKVLHERSGRTGVVVRIEEHNEWIYPIVIWDDDQTESSDQHLYLLVTNLDELKSRGVLK